VRSGDEKAIRESQIAAIRISGVPPASVSACHARLSGVDRGDSPTLVNDSSLYFQALKRGWIVLTRNVRDFDYFDQLLPADRVLFYEQA
jgi:predicted nucleic acid-binding protein